MKKLFYKARESFRAMLRQGISPREVSLAIASGATLSIFPVPGTTTVLTLAAARAFRLNIVVSQAANLLASPLQLLALVPFLKAGAWMLGIDDAVLSGQLAARIGAEGILPFFGDLGAMVPAAIAAWAIAAIPFFIVVYVVAATVLRFRTAPAQAHIGSGG